MVFDKKRAGFIFVLLAAVVFSLTAYSKSAMADWSLVYPRINVISSETDSKSPDKVEVKFKTVETLKRLLGK